MRYVWLAALVALLTLLVAGEGQPASYANGTDGVDLPKTGQTISYAVGDDGDLEIGVAWPTPRFTINADGTVTDNLTGLGWARDASTPTAGACTGGTKTWQGALDHVACLNGMSYLGHADWRLPNVNELESLITAADVTPASWLNGQGFQNVQTVTYYWSSTTDTESTDRAWEVSMWFSQLVPVDKANDRLVWPVRGTTSDPAQVWQTGQTTSYASGDDGDSQTGVAWPSPRFSVGTGAEADCLTDDLTGLMWVRSPDSIWREWQEALDHANGLSLCGHDDWRLPNRKELRSLVNYGQADKAAWLNTQGFSNVQPIGYWSSTTQDSFGGDTWAVSMERGDMGTAMTYLDFGVLPVRGTAPARSADISVAKTDSPDPVVTGRRLTYTVTVTNNGPDGATGVTLTDTLPSGTAFISAVSTQGTCAEAGGIVTCDVGSMENGGAVEVTIVVTAPDTAGEISNTATATAQETDPSPANNTVAETTSVNVPVGSADLSIAKIDVPDPVAVPNDLTYTLTVANDGPDEATGVVVTDTLPAAVDFVSASASQGTCSELGGVVTCELGDLANGGSAEITIIVGSTEAGIISNTADTIGNQNDPDPSNDTATAETEVILLPDITVDTTDIDFGSVPVGFGVHLFEVWVSNDGSADLILGDIAQADPLAEPFSIWVSDCDGVTLEPSPYVSCSIIVRFAPTTAGPFSDSFDIPSNDPDENPVTIDVSGTAVAVTELVVNSTADAGDANPGDGVCETAPGNDVCTLPAASEEANALPGPNSITVPPGTYPGGLAASDDVLIAGAGSAVTIVDGSGAAFNGCTDALSGVTIQNSPGPGIEDSTCSFTATDVMVSGSAGPGISSKSGFLTLTDVVIDGNTSDGPGGGINSKAGGMALTNVAITNNTATVGGGIYSKAGLTTLTDVVISGNQAIGDAETGLGGDGGGIYDSSRILATRVTIEDNTATGLGGGWWSVGLHSFADGTIEGNSADGGGGVFCEACGLTISDSTVSGNTAAGDGDEDNSDPDFPDEPRAGDGLGGGIASISGGVTLSNSMVIGNSVTSLTGDAGQGGGICNGVGGGLTATDSTVSGNTADGDGGGVHSDEDSGLTLTNATVNGNNATDGGGIYNEGSATLTNVTISGNTSTVFDSGGGVYNLGGLELTNVTVTGNSATPGGGVLNNGTATLKNTIVVGNTSDNCAGDAAITSDGYNLDSDGTCGLAGPGDLPDTGALLGPLADNGGLTQTCALLTDSPAIDAGSPDCPPPDTDQRGVARPIDGDGDGSAVCDIGAYEASEGVPTPTPTATSPAGPTPTPTATDTPATATATPTGEPTYAPTSTPRQSSPRIRAVPTTQPAATSTPEAAASPIVALPTQPPPISEVPATAVEPPETGTGGGSGSVSGYAATRWPLLWGGVSAVMLALAFSAFDRRERRRQRR